MGHVWDVAGMYAAVWYLVCLCGARYFFAGILNREDLSNAEARTPISLAVDPGAYWAAPPC